MEDSHWSQEKTTGLKPVVMALHCASDYFNEGLLTQGYHRHP
jgi:hypothetical protein